MTIDDWWQALSEHPRDYDRLRVFSDWLEEDGNVEWAEAMRWLAAQQKWPTFGTSELFHWYCRSCYGSSGDLGRNELPFPRDEFDEGSGIDFPTLTLALRWFCERFHLLQDVGRRLLPTKERGGNPSATKETM